MYTLSYHHLSSTAVLTDGDHDGFNDHSNSWHVYHMTF